MSLYNDIKMTPLHCITNGQRQLRTTNYTWRDGLSQKPMETHCYLTRCETRLHFDTHFKSCEAVWDYLCTPPSGLAYIIWELLAVSVGIKEKEIMILRSECLHNGAQIVTAHNHTVTPHSLSPALGATNPLDRKQFISDTGCISSNTKT